MGRLARARRTARRWHGLRPAGAPEAALSGGACLRLPSAPGSLGKLPAALAVLAGQSLISGLFSTRRAIESSSWRA